MKIKTMILGALMALSCSAVALPEAETMEAALVQAKAEKRDVFVDFTGTDWCTACIYLRTKIVESAEFEEALGKDFVLVSVDFPRSPDLVAKIPDEEKERRENLLASYRIEGLPGVVLMDAYGNPYDIIAGARPTPAEYIALVKAGQAKKAARDAALQKAASLTGTERAKALAEALKALPEACRDKYVGIIDEIKQLDPDNTLGFAELGSEATRRVQQQAELRELMASFSNKLTPADLHDSIVKLDAFLARENLDPEIRQAALSAKGDSYALLHEYRKMYACYKEALELAPESRAAKRIRGNVENFEKYVLPELEKQGK